MIQASGLRHEVGALGTTLEGEDDAGVGDPAGRARGDAGRRRDRRYLARQGRLGEPHDREPDAASSAERSFIWRQQCPPRWAFWAPKWPPQGDRSCSHRCPPGATLPHPLRMVLRGTQQCFGAPWRRDPTKTAPFNGRLAILLAMAMFVLVVDTSLMNVSISAVVHDLDTTVSGVQGAIALEALVSAAFILIGGKTGDLIGRKLAYVLGLLGYAVGAIAMVFAQDLDGDHHLLGVHRRHRRVAAAAGDAVAHPRQLRGRAAEAGVRARRRVGGHRRGRRPAARRVHHDVPLVAGRLRARGRDHRGRARRHRPREGRAVHRPAAVDCVGAVLSVVGMGGVVLGILVWQEGGGYVGLLIGVGVLALGSLVVVAARPQAAGQADADRPRLFESKIFRLGRRAASCCSRSPSAAR